MCIILVTLLISGLIYCMYIVMRLWFPINKERENFYGNKFRNVASYFANKQFKNIIQKRTCLRTRNNWK